MEISKPFAKPFESLTRCHKSCWQLPKPYQSHAQLTVIKLYYYMYYSIISLKLY